MLGAPRHSHIVDPIYGRPAQPTGRNPSGANNLSVKEDPRTLPGNTLRKSINPINNTFLDESSWRGDGASVISDRLNFGGRREVVGPPQIQYVDRPVERIVYEDEILPAVAPVNIIDDSINQNARNILAESMAKVCLLIMEGNRLKWVESQRTAELTRMRGGVAFVPTPLGIPPVPVVASTVTTPIVRPTTTVVSAPTTTVLRPSYTATTSPIIRPTTGVVTSTVPTVIRPTTGVVTTTGVAPLGIRTTPGVVTRVSQVSTNVGAPIRVSGATFGTTGAYTTTTGTFGSPVVATGAAGIPVVANTTSTMVNPYTTGLGVARPVGGAISTGTVPIRSSGVAIGSTPGGGISIGRQ